MKDIQRNWPHVTGTFIQPNAFTGYTEEMWEKHFEGLLEVGINIFIIQWTSDTPYGCFKDVFYPSEYAQNHKSKDGLHSYEGFLENVLSAAEKKGIKVFVGLNNSDEWWKIACTDPEWCRNQACVGRIQAKEIYSLYKSKYPKALYGWYYVWEMYNGMQGYEKAAADFLNMYLDPLTTLDASMPMLLSPFVRAHGGDAENAGIEWARVFETANFRENDIFCCQDAVGAGWITIDQLDNYFKALKKAVDTKPGLRFWANTEDFTTDGDSAPVDRFVRQMNIAKPYVEGFVTFAYSHYYAKDNRDKAPYHRAYKLYYDTGLATSFEIDKPIIITKTTSEGVSINISFVQSVAGTKSVDIYGDGKLLECVLIPFDKLDDKRISIERPVNTHRVYTVSVIDYFGNTASADASL